MREVIDANQTADENVQHQQDPTLALYNRSEALVRGGPLRMTNLPLGYNAGQKPMRSTCMPVHGLSTPARITTGVNLLTFRATVQAGLIAPQLGPEIVLLTHPLNLSDHQPVRSGVNGLRLRICGVGHRLSRR